MGHSSVSGRDCGGGISGGLTAAVHTGLTAIFMLFLADPSFVGSAFIQESLPKGNLVGDDDKIYFFFSEAGKEFDFFDNTIVSRIARVCKVSDALGQIVHLKEWVFFFFLLFHHPPEATSPRTQIHHWGESDGPLLHFCVCLLSTRTFPHRRACRLVDAVNMKNEAGTFLLSDDPGSPVTEKHSSRVSPPSSCLILFLHIPDSLAPYRVSPNICVQLGLGDSR